MIVILKRRRPLMLMLFEVPSHAIYHPTITQRRRWNEQKHPNVLILSPSMSFHVLTHSAHLFLRRLIPCHAFAFTQYNERMCGTERDSLTSDGCPKFIQCQMEFPVLHRNENVSPKIRFILTTHSAYS